MKSIPKVKSQIPLPSQHTQAPILNQWTLFVAHLGFGSITDPVLRRSGLTSQQLIRKSKCKQNKQQKWNEGKVGLGRGN